MEKFIVVNVNDHANPWPLMLDYRTRKECERAISWQGIGQSASDLWAIKAKKEVAQLLRDGIMKNAIYTTVAWDRFQTRSGV